MKYSALSLLRDGLSSVGRPTRILQNVSPKKKYEVVVIGGGAHGLACAHYLARNYDITNVAVLDSGWIGGGTPQGTPPSCDRIICSIPVLS